MHARGESLCESRMRETRTSGSTRGEVRGLQSLPLLLYRHPRLTSEGLPIVLSGFTVVQA